MKKFKKKLLKTFSVFLVVFCLVFVSCFSVSATTTYNFSCSQPQLQGNDGYVEFILDDGQACIVYFKLNYFFDSIFIPEADISFSAEVTSDFNFIISTVPENWSESDRAGFLLTGYYFYDNSYGRPLYSGDSYIANKIGLYLGPGRSIVSIRGYNCDVSNISSHTNLHDFIFAYGNDININNKLDSIIDILQNGGFTQIGALIGKATQDTDKLLENQEQYQDEILNGWQPDDDVDFDSSVNDEYSDLDKELIDSTADGRAEADEVFDNFDSLLETEDDNPETPSSHNHLTNGLLCVTAIFNEFTKIDWLHNILTFSLALGVFSFVIGTASAVFKSAHEKHEYKKASKKSSSDDS